MIWNLKKIIVSTFLLLILSCYGINVQASPAFKREIKLYQPGGEEITAVIKGDERNNWISTKNGDVIIKGNDNYWYYAKKSLTGVNAGNHKYLIDSKPDYALNDSDMVKIKKNAPILDSIFQSKGYLSNEQMIKSLSGASHPLLVILVDFNDSSMLNDDLKWSKAFFDDYSNSVRAYYSEVSKGSFSFTPAAESYNSNNDGVIRVKLNYNHINTGGNVSYLNQNVVKDALTAANTYIDYSTYDKDNNGFISTDELHIVTILAGYESSYSNKIPGVWGHKASLSYYYAANLDNVTLGYSGGGGGYLQIGEIHDDHMATIGIICHELGHDLGLPDLYDTDDSSQGVGPHSLMGSGSWGCDSIQYPGNYPTHLDPWSKIYLGFDNPQTVTSGKYTINQSGSSGYNIIKIPTSNANEYFLVENREYNGFDRGLWFMVNNGGAAIWHIDESVIKSKFASNTINDDEFHKGIDIEEADEMFAGKSKLDSNIGYNLDSYYRLGYNSIFNGESKPGSLMYSGESTNYVISVQSYSGSQMTIDISQKADNVNNMTVTGTSPVNGALNIPVNSLLKLSFSLDIVQGTGINGIVLKDSIGNVVPYTTSISGNCLTVKPNISLDYGKNYSLIVPFNAVKGMGGEVLSSQYLLNFTTEADKVSPVVKTSKPANNSLNNSVGSEIEVVFSEKIAKGVNFGKIVLADAYNKPVACSLIIINNEIIVKPLSLLEYGTKYCLTIPGGTVKDIAGNALSSEFKMYFTTSPQPFSHYNRLSGYDRYETSISISKMGWNTSKYVVLASGENFPDALSAGPLAKKYSAPILLTEAKTLDSRVEMEIGRLKADTVYIVGGTGVIYSDIENRLKSKGISCKRLAGSDRFGTAVKVASEIGTANGVFIANGFNYPDALSIASYAAFKGMPILLTETDALPDSIRQFISANKIGKSFIIGGTGVVSNKVMGILPNPERLSGRDRYETNIIALNRFGSEFNLKTVMIASGEGFPDALSGSAFASLTKSPIILTASMEKDISPKTVQYITNNRNIIISKYILGGSGVVPEKVVNYLFN